MKIIIYLILLLISNRCKNANYISDLSVNKMNENLNGRVNPSMGRTDTVMNLIGQSVNMNSSLYFSGLNEYARPYIFQKENGYTKLGNRLKDKATTAYNLGKLLDGDIVSALCGLIGGHPGVCKLLSVTELNKNEESELKKIVDKKAFEEFLTKRKIKPDVFYEKLYNERNNKIILKCIDSLSKAVPQIKQG